jgi:hypothetical protein
MAKKIDKAARLDAIRLAATKAKEPDMTNSKYAGMSQADRNLASTRDAGLASGRRTVEAAPVREVPLSEYKPAPSLRPDAQRYGPATIEGILTQAKASRAKAAAKPKTPSGAIQGPAVTARAPKLRSTSVPSRVTPPMDVRTSAPKPVVVKTQRTGKAATPKFRGAPPIASKMTPPMDARTSAPRPVVVSTKRTGKPAAPKFKGAAPIVSKMTPPMDSRSSLPKRVSVSTQRVGKPVAPAPVKAPAPKMEAPVAKPRFGAGAGLLGAGMIMQGAAGIYDSYVRDQERKSRQAKKK